MYLSKLKSVSILLLVILLSTNLMAFNDIPGKSSLHNNIFISIISILISQNSLFDYYLIYDFIDHSSDDTNETISITGHLVIPRLSGGD